MSRQGSLFRLTIGFVVVIIVVAYTLFNSRLIIKGPVVIVESLTNGQIIEGDNLIEIKGKTENISFISLNGRQIFIDKDQNFSETILLTNKINPIEIYAEDKFGKITAQKFTLVYKNKQKIEIPEEFEIIGEEIQENSTSTDDELI